MKYCETEMNLRSFLDISALIRKQGEVGEARNAEKGKREGGNGLPSFTSLLLRVSQRRLNSTLISVV